MSAPAIVAVASVALWVVLVVTAQLLTPEQSLWNMGMSGLANGRFGLLMKSAFVVRGLSALALVAAVAGGAPAPARSGVGVVLLAVWGVGSTLLAVYDTDMPGDDLTRHGRIHALVATVAYGAAAVGILLVSSRLSQGQSSAWVARWALPIALVAALVMLAQFAGFGAAAHHPARGLARCAGLLQRAFLVLVMLWTVVVAVRI
jgi:hypothetical protein